MKKAKKIPVSLIRKFCRRKGTRRDALQNILICGPYMYATDVAIAIRLPAKYVSFRSDDIAFDFPGFDFPALFQKIDEQLGSGSNIKPDIRLPKIKPRLCRCRGKLKLDAESDECKYITDGGETCLHGLVFDKSIVLGGQCVAPKYIHLINQLPSVRMQSAPSCDKPFIFTFLKGAGVGALMPRRCV